MNSGPATSGLNSVSSSASPRRAAISASRLAIYGLVCVMLMFADQRSNWLESLRGGLQAVVYPIKLVLYSPISAWHSLSEVFAERSQLQRENATLKEKVAYLEIQAMRRADLEVENARLRELNASTSDVAERILLARIVAQESSRQRRRVTIDRGSEAGVRVGQTVVAGGGIVGQTMRVGSTSSEIILLTDPEHAIPVEIQRTGVRTVAIGTGRTNLLNLPSLPLQSDILEGDLLVSSGLGGIFPTGYPVATVTRVVKSNSSLLAQVEARSISPINSTRQVALLWFNENHSAAPWIKAREP
jgi:rod shape-determining protein MreC